MHARMHESHVCIFEFAATNGTRGIGNDFSLFYPRMIDNYWG